MVTKQTYQQQYKPGGGGEQQKRPWGNLDIEVQKSFFHNLKPFPVENLLNVAVYGPLNSSGDDPVRFPQLMYNGKVHHLYLKCLFAVPMNKCWYTSCKGRSRYKKRYNTPNIPRLHIDLGIEEWKTQPREFWNLLVTFSSWHESSPF